MVAILLYNGLATGADDHSYPRRVSGMQTQDSAVPQLRALLLCLYLHTHSVR